MYSTFVSSFAELHADVVSVNDGNRQVFWFAICDAAEQTYCYGFLKFAVK